MRYERELFEYDDTMSVNNLIQAAGWDRLIDFGKAGTCRD